jgi:hypothetical protein
MWDIIQFIVRIIAFAVTFYLVCEYIVSCKINTYTGAFVVLAVLVSVTALFVVFRQHDIITCNECKQLRFVSPIEKFDLQ